ncbi:hypothetical protein VZC37_08305 [Gordonia sp. LSe1-13]|uniref:Uncharacterized protein n=1 Tax=Gordonia sesuvii TaxID=3116777 RepID=A0ABU7MB50_9ACTN|nr:hypothetical protein [Gordonia sp. LSe1-13]
MHVPRPQRPIGSSPQVHRPRAVVAIAGVVAVTAVLSACGTADDSTTPDVPTVTPATAPAALPGPAAQPAGLVVPTAPESRAMVVGDGTVAVLDAAGTSVLRYTTADPGAEPQVSETPELTQIVSADDGEFVGVGPGSVARIGRDGTVETAALDVDDPTALARTASGDLLVGTADGRVLVVDDELAGSDDELVPGQVIDGFVRVDDITVSPPDADLPEEQVVVLDRAQSSVTPVTVSDGDLGPALRAGNGATNAAVDRFGRVLVANTRDDEIVGFFGSPLVMRFRYPVPGGPYAVDYDDERNLMWVSTTANNEVVAYDLSGGEPVEKRRVPTVAQPDSIAVDDASGTLYVLSERGGLQVIGVGG